MNDQDKMLLQRLMLQELPKRRRFLQSLGNFFSHPAWQSVGVIISLLSLIVTIILTMYVFNLGRDQETAHIDADFYPNTMSGALPADYSDKNIYSRQVINLYNNGPSVGEAVIVSIVSAHELRCQQAGADGFWQGKATKVVSTNGRCDLYFDYFYPRQIASIYVVETKDLIERDTSSEFDIHPGDGVWWMVSGRNIDVSMKDHPQSEN